MTLAAAPRLTVSATELGTPESAWLASTEILHCPPMTWSLARGAKVVVIAPHPDDEILAVGGTLVTLVRMYECAIHVVAVTEGEASHPRSSSHSPEMLRERRARERDQAFHQLGVTPHEVVRLEVPDGGAKWTKDLSHLLSTPLDGAALCLAPWERDGHPDHDATGRAARDICDRRNVPLLEYPVWAWHWAKPAQRDLPWERARKVPLDAGARAAKHAAIAAYRSQIEPLGDGPGDEPILPPAVLARFLRPFEILFS